MKAKVRGLLVLAAVLATSTAADASLLTVTFQQEGPNVVVSASGSFDAGALSFFNTEPAGQAGMFAQVSGGYFGEAIVLGTATSADYYLSDQGENYFPDFLAAGSHVASFSSGDFIGFGFAGGYQEIELPAGYAGPPLSATMTFLDQSYSSLGLTPGVSSGTYSNGYWTATITLDILPAPVPAPMAGAGLPGLIFAGGGLLAWCRRNRKAEPVAA